MDHISKISSIHGIMSVIIGFGIPILLCLLVMIPWKPKTRGLFALKFSLWPTILLSFNLGGPISRALIGHKISYMLDVNQTIKGLIGLLFVTCPIFFVIGYLLSLKICSKNKIYSTQVNNCSQITNEANEYLVCTDCGLSIDKKEISSSGLFCPNCDGRLL
jgi:hypothetical protein